MHAAAAEARRLACRVDVAERGAVGPEHPRGEVGRKPAQRFARQYPEPHRDQRPVGRIEQAVRLGHADQLVA